MPDTIHRKTSDSTGHADDAANDSQCDPIGLPSGDHREEDGNTDAGDGGWIASWAVGLAGASPAASFPELKSTTKPEPGGRALANHRLRKAMGRRFVVARKRAGLRQSEASALLGWANPTQLSLIEHGQRMPPHELLLRASTVYGVATDFLYGLVEDSDQRRGHAGAPCPTKATRANAKAGSVELEADTSTSSLNKVMKETFYCLSKLAAVSGCTEGDVLRLFETYTADLSVSLQGKSPTGFRR